MYFVEKEAVYSHGVFHITNDRLEAITRCKLFAYCDRDDHHGWYVREYKEIPVDQIKNHAKEDALFHNDIFLCRKSDVEDEWGTS